MSQVENVLMVGFMGGPCGGKTEISRIIKLLFSDLIFSQEVPRGVGVYSLPEAYDYLNDSGSLPERTADEAEWRQLIQKSLFQTQIENELAMGKMIEEDRQRGALAPDGFAIVLCDGTLPGIASYRSELNFSFYSHILSEYGQTADSFSDLLRRYNLILFYESLTLSESPTDYESFYYDERRLDSPEIAKEIDERQLLSSLAPWLIRLISEWPIEHKILNSMNFILSMAFSGDRQKLLTNSFNHSLHNPDVLIRYSELQWKYFPR